MRLAWELQFAEGIWMPTTPAGAAEAVDDGIAVRLVTESDQVFSFVHRRLDVPRWLIKSGLRKGFVVEACALACLVFEGLGWTRREVAEAVGMASPSSVQELADSYRDQKDIRECLRAASEVFGSFMLKKSTPGKEAS